MTASGAIPSLDRSYTAPAGVRRGLRLTVAAGALVFVAGLFAAPERVWGGFLMGFDYLTALALAGPVFAAFLAVAGARWWTVVRRVPEAMAAALPVAGLLGLVLLFGTHSLYEWTHSSVVEQDALLQHKAAWLNPPAFALRLVLVFLIWIALSRRLITLSRRFAETGSEEVAASRLRTSAFFIAVLAVTFSVASFDWLMSLEPHWFSTIFALMRFGGMCAVGLAAAILLVLALERQGALRGVLRDEHLHDMGKLLFALTLFWAYCWYCQYMLIWYTDIPEETAHYVLRREGSWWLLVQTTLVLKWAVPFGALLARRTCRSRVVLARVALVVLVGHAVDLYVQVGPPLMGPDPMLGVWEIGPVVGAVALFFLVAIEALGRMPAVHGPHPHLADSLSYHTPLAAFRARAVGTVAARSTATGEGRVAGIPGVPGAMQHRTIPTALASAMACLLFLTPAAPAAAPQVGQQRPVLPREVPRDAPSGLRPLDESLPRSAGLAVSVGPYVSVQANVDGAGQNVVGDAANEPSIAVNPTDPDNMVIGWRQFDTIASDFRQAGWAYTLDGGQSWTFPGVLQIGVFRSDPVLDADVQGTFYYQSLYLGGGGAFLNSVFRSTDGGVSWAPPVDAFGGDKNWMVVDKSGGLGDGHVYGTWQPFFDCCAGKTLTRSTDGGASFERPVELHRRPLFGTMAVGPDGTLFVGGCQGTFGQDLDTFVVTRSVDAQDPAATPTSTGVIVPMGGGLGVSQAPNPSGLTGQVNVGVDASGGPQHGNVYLLAAVDPNGAFSIGPTEIRFSRSTDGGVSWSPSVRVNDDPAGNGAWHWMGAMSVAPNGRIDAVWNDTRSSGLANVSELFYAYSTDGGRRWTPNQPVSPPFDTHLGWPSQSKIGDYYTLVSNETGADVAYSATFNGEQDVYYLRVFPDCDGNGVSDVTDIALGLADDCNGNQIPDACDIAFGLSRDEDANGVPDECEAPWADLGNALAGTHGEPLLVGSGTLVGGSPVSLTLTGALENSSATLVVGLAADHTPFKGGVMVPSVDVPIPGLATGPAGSLVLASAWPGGVQSGFATFFQAWILDAAGPAGFAASNAVSATGP